MTKRQCENTYFLQFFCEKMPQILDFVKNNSNNCDIFTIHNICQKTIAGIFIGQVFQKNHMR